MGSEMCIRDRCNLLSILDEYPDYQLIISYPNADTKNRAIIELLEKYYLKDKKRTFLTHSLGLQKYLSAVKHCELVVGNSSSGIIEAPTLGVPTVNIGDRQKGRIHGYSVLNCDDSLASIRKTMAHALSSDFRQLCKNAKIKKFCQILVPSALPGATPRFLRHAGHDESTQGRRTYF